MPEIFLKVWINNNVKDAACVLIVYTNGPNINYK